MEAGAAQTRLPIALIPGASLASFWASRKKLAAGAAKRPFDIAFRFIRRQHKKPPAFPKEVSIL